MTLNGHRISKRTSVRFAPVKEDDLKILKMFKSLKDVIVMIQIILGKMKNQK